MTLSTCLPSPARAARRLATATLVVAASAATLGTLQGCVLLVGGAAVGGALSFSDRRTSGAQIEDQAIEIKAGNRVGDVMPDRGHVNVTSYNRVVLVTGEVPSEADKAATIKTISAIENVGSVVDELEVGEPSSVRSRASDTAITTKVKASLIDAKDLQANAFKVVTERGVVYLMGRVTEREAGRAVDIARGVSGVMKVVRVFEVLSEADLANLQNK